MKSLLNINRILIMLIINSIIFPFIQFYFVFFHNRFLMSLSSHIFIFIDLILIISIILSIFSKKHLVEILAIIFILFFSLLNFLFFSDIKLEGGHDPGVYFQNSIQIFKDASFSITNNNFLTYPGYFLNTDNGNIATQFPPGFSLYLSLFHSLSDNYILNVNIAITCLLFISSILLFYSLKNFTNSQIASLIGLILFIINYYTITFYRATYVETYLTFIIFTIIYLSKKIFIDKKYLFVSLLASISLIYIRSESISNLIIFLGLALYSYFKHFNKNKKLNRSDYFALMIYVSSLGCIFLYCCFIFNYFSNVIDPIKNMLLNFKSNKNVSTTSIPNLKYNPLIFHAIYFFKTIIPFSFLPIIALIFVKIKTLDKKIIINLLLLLIIFLPQVIYIVYPGIAFYLPWYFRRIYPYFIPFSIILFSIVISRLSKNRINILIIALIIIINMLLSANIISYKETGLVQFNEKIINFIQNNKTDKIIFVDRLNIERYASTVAIMDNMRTIYDRIPFSSLDFYKCFLNKNEKTYIVTTIQDSNILKDNLNLEGINLIDKFSIKESSIEGSCDLRSYVMKPYLFTTYKQLFNQCTYPPDKQNENLNDIYIYKISSNIEARNCSKYQIYNMSKIEIIKEYNSYL